MKPIDMLTKVKIVSAETIKNTISQKMKSLAMISFSNKTLIIILPLYAKAFIAIHGQSGNIFTQSLSCL